MTRARYEQGTAQSGNRLNKLKRKLDVCEELLVHGTCLQEYIVQTKFLINMMDSEPRRTRGPPRHTGYSMGLGGGGGQDVDGQVGREGAGSHS